MERRHGTRFTLHDAAAVEAVLDRMARGCAALLAGVERPLLVGMLRRGAPLGRAIAARLAARHGLADIEATEVKIQRYADDLAVLHPETLLAETPEQPALDLSGRTVLLVDDVLYEGHSLWRAVGWLRAKGADCVRTAVLADRNVARLPVHADVVGLRLEVPAGWVVECKVPPYEPTLGIDLNRLDPAPQDSSSAP
jgi:pyrimidine operon attenuation protein/uracil phosphoribosyltransferase